MAVSILGSGIAPVTGAREFDPIGGAGGSGVTISSGDVNNYIMTSTGTGNDIQGESNLTFNGSTLTITGGARIPDISSASDPRVLVWDSSTGEVGYNENVAGGGST
jgi:hypothetical protein